MKDSRLVRYYQHQKAQGNSAVTATLTLPSNFYRYANRVRSRGGAELGGYGHYDVPLLASYSRSGTNWLRYTIEWISRRPTPGQVRLAYGGDYVIDRAHQAYPVMDKYPSVVLVVRDYRECLVRHHNRAWQHFNDVGQFLETEEIPQPPSWYIKNIEAFDAFEGPKLLVYYEDLVAEPGGPIRELSKFIGMDAGRTEEFIATVDVRKEESLNAYQRRDHTSETGGSKDFGYHSKKNLTEDQIREFDDYYRSNHPELFEKYLTRYASSTTSS